ncbi:hypothetical protein DV532_04955 [Pseudomonas sp. Leaf58]|nr:hypothetical protein DV532_04955 [Pseudomonas sp. Leaf58]
MCGCCAGRVDSLSCPKKPTPGSAFSWALPAPASSRVNPLLQVQRKFQEPHDPFRSGFTREEATQHSIHFFCFGTRTSWLSE